MTDLPTPENPDRVPAATADAAADPNTRSNAGPNAEPSGGCDPTKRRQILDGARQVFRAKGFDGASMGEIGKAAGVSKGTLYVYFKDKPDLFRSLVIEDKREQADALFRLDPSDPDTRRVLRELGLNYLDLLCRPDHLQNIRMVLTASERFPEMGRAFYEAGPAQGCARLSAYLDTQVLAGRLVIDDTTLAAQHFLDLCQSGLLRRALFGMGEDGPRTDRAHLVDQALRVFFAAYAA